MPISFLKIDKEFIDDAATSLNDAAITKSIIRLADNLDLTTIAEGIENKEQLDFLKYHHCPMWQGYYFAKPMTVDKLLLYLKKYKK